MAAETSLNVLMTGAGAPGAAGIIKCLYQDPAINVVTADADPGATGRYLSNDFITIPQAGDPRFIDALLGICREKNIHVLLPLVTKELIPLARQQEQFEMAGTKVLVSPAHALEIANNKSRLYQFLEWRGLAVPAYRVVETIDQFKTATGELGYPQTAVCFKPSVSNGSRGFRIIDSSINEAAILFDQKPGAGYISYDEAIKILSLRPFPELLVSEYLPGDEYSVDCLANHGDMIIAVPRLRSKMIGGISVKGSFIQNEPIIDYCKKLVHELQLHGNIGIQLKLSTKKEPLILEINPRVQGTIAAALGAGINLPLLAIKQELGLSLLPEELQVKWGVHFSRYWSEVFY